MRRRERKLTKIPIALPGKHMIKVIVVKSDLNTFPTFELAEGWFDIVTDLLAEIAARDEELEEITVRYRDESEPRVL